MPPEIGNFVVSPAGQEYDSQAGRLNSEFPLESLHAVQKVCRAVKL